MPTNQSKNPETIAFEDFLNEGHLRNAPGYAVRTSWLLLQHCDYKTMWAWPGRRRMEEKLGLNGEYQNLAIMYWVEMGVIVGWGYAKTNGKPGLAYKMDLKAPLKKAPSHEKLQGLLADYSGPQVKKSTCGLCSAYLRTIFGQPADYVEIKRPITLKNPKEPYQQNVAKPLSKKKGNNKMLNEYKRQAEKLGGITIIKIAYNNLSKVEFAEFKRHYLNYYRSQPGAKEDFEQIEGEPRGY